MKKVIMLASIAAIACPFDAFAAASCASMPSCESMGYVLTESDCSGSYALQCPFDTSKYYCTKDKAGSGSESSQPDPNAERPCTGTKKFNTSSLKCTESGEGDAVIIDAPVPASLGSTETCTIVTEPIDNPSNNNPEITCAEFLATKSGSFSSVGVATISEVYASLKRGNTVSTVRTAVSESSNGTFIQNGKLAKTTLSNTTASKVYCKAKVTCKPDENGIVASGSPKDYCAAGDLKLGNYCYSSYYGYSSQSNIAYVTNKSGSKVYGVYFNQRGSTANGALSDLTYAYSNCSNAVSNGDVGMIRNSTYITLMQKGYTSWLSQVAGPDMTAYLFGNDGGMIVERCPVGDCGSGYGDAAEWKQSGSTYDILTYVYLCVQEL